MYLDAQLLFSDSQAITAAAASTNLIDTGPLFGSNLGRNLGVGRRKYIFLNVEVSFTDAGSDSTLTVALQTDDNAAFSSAATVATLGTLAALTAAGSTFFYPVPIAADAVPYERFIRLQYTPNNGNLSTGTLSAGIINDISAWTSTFGSFATGI